MRQCDDKTYDGRHKIVGEDCSSFHFLFWKNFFTTVVITWQQEVKAVYYHSQTGLLADSNKTVVKNRLNTELSYLLLAQLRISQPHAGILGSLPLAGVSRENLYLVHSVSECICTGSLTTTPKCTGSHFRPTESLRIPTSALLPTTFDCALLQPTPLARLNADFLSPLHLAFE